MIMFVIKT